MENIELIREILCKSPSTIERTDIIEQVALYLLPENTGIELECDKKKNYEEKHFLGIGLVKINTDDGEQRYQIPKGLDGFITLEKLSELLCIYSLENPKSGNHYHINASEFFSSITSKIIEDNKDWILNELDSWKYKGTYNDRDVDYSRKWVRLCSPYKTIEFRIGEMTFDYKLLIKRILHCQDIVRRFKYICLSDEYSLDTRIKSLEKQLITTSNINLEEINTIIQNRKVKITY